MKTTSTSAAAIGVDLVEARPHRVEPALRRRGIREERVLGTIVLGTMSRVPRERFLPPDPRPCLHGRRGDDRLRADDVTALRGRGHLSAPRAHGRERVLDVGTGSGYQAAVLAGLAAEVLTVERRPELTERARAALEAAGTAR